jgi:Zn-finger nucleic acid-binding protein
MTTKLVCPKCGGPMRTYSRNGITIDQCAACHGIFLDRGELERPISAESSYLDGAALRQPD